MFLSTFDSLLSFRTTISKKSGFAIFAGIPAGKHSVLTEDSVFVIMKTEFGKRQGGIKATCAPLLKEE